MSHIIDNRSAERDMTNNFVCVLYFKDHNCIEVKKNGMDPFEIWKILKYNAFDENVVPAILNRLIFNSKRRKFITYNAANRKVSLTVDGRRWGETTCPKLAVPFGG